MYRIFRRYILLIVTFLTLLGSRTYAVSSAPWVQNRSLQEDIQAFLTEVAELIQEGNLKQANEIIEKTLDAIERNIGEGTIQNYAEVLTLLQKLLTVLRENKTDEFRYSEGKILTLQGIIYTRQGAFEPSIDAYKEALSIWQTINDPQNEETVLNNLGLVYTDVGYYDEALKVLQKALQIQFYLQDQNICGLQMENACGQVGEVLCQQLIDMCQQTKQISIAGTQSNIGSVYNYTGDYPIALTSFQSAFTRLESAIGRLKQYYPEEDLQVFEGRLGAILDNIGLVYQNQGKYLEALNYHQQAYSILKDLSNPLDVAIAEQNIGLVYESWGDYRKALQEYEKSLLTLGDRDRRVKAAILQNMARTYRLLGDEDNAEIKYNQSLDIYRSINIKTRDNRGLAEVLTGLGTLKHKKVELLTKLDRPNQKKEEFDEAVGKALQYYQEARDIYNELLKNPEGEAVILTNLGDLSFLQGEFSDALSYFQEAERIFANNKYQDGIARTHTGQGMAYRALGKFDLALEQYNQAMVIHNTSGNRAEKIRTLHNMGVLYEAQGDPKQAILEYTEAVSVTESIALDLPVEDLKSKFFDERIDTYERLIELLWQEKNYPEAFNYAEKARARTFLEQLANGPVDILQCENLMTSPSVPEDISTSIRQQACNRQQDIIETQNTIANESKKNMTNQSSKSEEDKLDSLQKQFRNAINRLKVVDPMFSQRQGLSTISLSEVLAQINAENTTILVYFVMEEHTLMWLLNHKGMTPIMLPISRSELHQIVQKFSGSSPDLSELNELSRLLFSADYKIPELNENLVVIPHGDLHYVPFAALSDPSTQELLVQRHTFTYAPSVSVQFAISKNSSPTQSALMLTNPIVGLPPLLYAETEAQNISQIIKKKYGEQSLLSGGVLFGTKASEGAIWTYAKKAGILHLSTHAKFEVNNPFFSKIYLSRNTQLSTPRDNGFLEVYELYALDLTNSDLVVLSACETDVVDIGNGGNIGNGDDVISLSRGFTAGAGASSLLATLWLVDEKSTGALLEQFYDYWLNHNMPKAKALQQAQLDVMEMPEYSEAKYWAAFTLYGDGGVNQ